MTFAVPCDLVCRVILFLECPDVLPVHSPMVRQSFLLELVLEWLVHCGVAFPPFCLGVRLVPQELFGLVNNHLPMMRGSRTPTEAKCCGAMVVLFGIACLSVPKPLSFWAAP